MYFCKLQIGSKIKVANAKKAYKWNLWNISFRDIRVWYENQQSNCNNVFLKLFVT